VVATVGQGFTGAERRLLAWAGLRGAVPVILATFAVIDNVPRAIELLNIVFFAVLLSATLQGTTIQPLAARAWRSAGGDPAAESDQPRARPAASAPRPPPGSAQARGAE
jgi:cell volume regulation protein A